MDSALNNLKEFICRKIQPINHPSIIVLEYLVLRKIFSHVPTHPEPTLALLYPYQEHLSFYMHNIHINGIKKKEYTNVRQQL